MKVKSGIKRKSINNYETPNKLRKTKRGVNEKTAKKFAKNQKTPQKVNTNKFQRTPWKKNKQISEEKEEQSENESEEQVEVDSNEESDAVEQNDLEDSDDDNEKESDSDEGQEEAEKHNSKEDPEENVSDKKVVKQPKTVINEARITVVPKKHTAENQTFNIYVGNLHISKLEDIFADCKILARKIIPRGVLLCMEDENSIQKALEKNQTEHDGRLISVQRHNCYVYLKGLTENMKMEEIFADCKIHSYSLFKHRQTGKLLGTGKICFKDVDSLKNALAKSGTEIDGRIITVKLFQNMMDRKKNYRNMNDRNTNNIESTLQLLKAQAWELDMKIKNLERQRGNKPFFKRNTFKMNTNNFKINGTKSFVKGNFNPKNNE